MEQADVAIIGAGIIGLATAYQLTGRDPGQRVVILEKEQVIAHHQTGHNSGVLHSGIYYKPGSLKAINCRQGKAAMEAFCAEHDVDYEICGKVIVAVDEKETPALERIYQRGRQNNVKCELIGPERLAVLEPHAQGVKAIHVPEAGIVNFRQVCQKLAQILAQRQCSIVTGAKVTAVRSAKTPLVIETTAGDFQADYLINCAGLHNDRVMRLSGTAPKAKIVPFRGEYFELRPEAHHLCRNLIYPTPDPNFPFLGVHFTRMIEGGVECGPNAVLAFAREGYRKTDVNLRDLWESLTYRGFWKLSLKYWRVGLGEMWRSVSKRAFVKALQRLVPEIRGEHLEAAPAGVRAQAIMPDGAMVDDFLIQESERIIHVGNAPSPGATASLNIGKIIAEKLMERIADN